MYGLHPRVGVPAARFQCKSGHFQHKNHEITCGKYTRLSLLIHVPEQGSLGMRLSINFKK